jgi:hypothetical protein
MENPFGFLLSMKNFLNSATLCGRIVHGLNRSKNESGFRLNGATPTKHWGSWLRVEDSRYRRSSSLTGAQKVVKSGKENSGGVAAEPYVGGGESLHPENQVATPSASPKEKTRPARFENSGRENSADGAVVGPKEGAVSKAGNESFNAEDSEGEVLGDMLETTKQKEQRQVAVDEVNIPITQGSFGDFNC